MLFGSADGWVYALRASDGKLVWRFRGAPQERQAGAFNQLESVWPVHGSVLVQRGVLYCVAGRSTYIDGGLVLYRLDPLTGKELSRTRVCELDPNTDKQLAGEGRFDMQGATTDILSGDGELVFLKQLSFDASGKRTTQTRPHLFAATGLLGEEWFVRSYWLLGTNVGTGWGGWANVARQVPAGRILCFTEDRVYGYGRVTVSSGATGHKADAYHLFCRQRRAALPTSTEAKANSGGKAKRKARSRRAKARRRPAPKLAPPVWADTKALTVRAMVLAANKLVIAGPPDLGRKQAKVLAFVNEGDALAAFTGQKGVLLQVRSAADGRKLSEQPLSAMPVFDGMSAAGRRIFLSLQDGAVQCWGP
ncbi:MAG: hypothetical protein AMK72_09650 [Planctomycetes bacterium SM23_25]|nr:MAG: hypothetical protein AMK72_09650 [Planctomycetes bacterium SM23_25]